MAKPLLDHDADGYVMRLERLPYAGVPTRDRLVLTINSGNHQTTVDLWDDEALLLSRALKRGVKK